VTFGRVVFKICEWTKKQSDKPTNRQTGILIIIPGGEVTTN